MTDGTVKRFNATRASGGANVPGYDFNGVADNRPVELEIGEGQTAPQPVDIRVL